MLDEEEVMAASGRLMSWNFFVLIEHFLFDRKSWKQRWSDPKWSKAMHEGSQDNPITKKVAAGASSVSPHTFSFKTQIL